jgi:hypothetical protein
MAGDIGSGKRWGYEARKETASCLVLDVGELAGGPVIPGRIGYFTMRPALAVWSVPVVYIIRRIDGLKWTITWQFKNNVLEHHIDLEPSKLASGGTRFYMRCPGLAETGPCNRRVTKLYWPMFGWPVFACRACHHLAYRSSQTRPNPAWMKRLRQEALALHFQGPTESAPLPTAEDRRYRHVTAARCRKA